MRDIRAGSVQRRRPAAARRRSARGDPGRRRARPRGPARNGARSEPERHEQRRSSRRTEAARCRAGRSSRCDGCARRRSAIIRRYDVKTPGPGDAGAQPLRRQPPEARPRARVRRTTRSSSSSPSRRAASTSARSRRCTRTSATRRPKGVAILLMSEDLDEIRALADRILVMYEGEIVGELHAGCGVDRGDRAAHGRRARRVIARAPARAAVVAVRRRARRLARWSPSRSWRSSSRRAGTTRATTYREDRRGRLHRQRGAVGDAHLGDADPLHGARRGRRVPHAALQHRRRGAALPRGDRRLVDRAPARRSRRRRRRRSTSSRCASRRLSLGALWALIPGVLRAFARTNEIITSLMLNYVAGLPPHVPDLRQRVVLARHVDAPGAGVPAGEADARGVQLADLRLVGRRPARLPHRAGSRRSPCGCCTRACGSGSRWA